MVDMQELVIWTSLNWRFLKPSELEAVFQETARQVGGMAERSGQECVHRLMVRGLIVSGSGDTEYDALYDLLGSLFIIPADGNLLYQILSFCRLTVLERISFRAARKLFRKDNRTDKEKQVMGLANQALLSTAEIIKCVENNVRRLPNEESIVERLYSDRETTSDNISSIMRISAVCRPVTLAVANLYLRKQIILERV